MRFIEVKGRVTGAGASIVARNEILFSLNKLEDHILAIVEFSDDNSHQVDNLYQPFQQEPEFGVTSVNYSLAVLVAHA